MLRYNVQGLGQSFKSVVIYILIEVEGIEYVKRVGKVNFPRDGSLTLENRQKMRSTEDGINVHDGHNPIPVVIEVWFENPQAVVRVWISEALAELVDERALEDLLLK